mmetsp:Transcript_173872/g.557285  ORF Transcript_173872/g.557285 Transcript_173872/m.557285 type:complete len:209 (-) Transcript_173872:410-1036(-)
MATAQSIPDMTMQLSGQSVPRLFAAWIIQGFLHLPAALSMLRQVPNLAPDGHGGLAPLRQYRLWRLLEQLRHGKAVGCELDERRMQTLERAAQRERLPPAHDKACLAISVGVFKRVARHGGGGGPVLARELAKRVFLQIRHHIHTRGGCQHRLRRSHGEALVIRVVVVAGFREVESLLDTPLLLRVWAVRQAHGLDTVGLRGRHTGVT